MEQKIREFQEVVWEYYRAHGRDLPWRQEPLSGYAVLVSEVMLQQTQVVRVIPKYQEFLHQFPDMKALASASLSDVIKVWSGLGYNRRAKYLHETGKTLDQHPEPWTTDVLTACKGIGLNTASAVVTYAYNQPTIFIETNIRTVYIYHFFPDRTDVHDREILELVSITLPKQKKQNTREWYWAIMDYGSYLKKTVGNQAHSSAHYVKQSRFEGSDRQVRGKVLKLLTKNPQTEVYLQTKISDHRLGAVLAKLQSEGMIVHKDRHYQLAS